jgi:hypothetical protein
MGAAMESKIIIALVVLVVVAVHIALYRWVKFKIQEGVILQFLRDSQEEGAPDHHHADAIAVHTGIPVARVAAVCLRSREIHSDPEAENSWRCRR